MNKKILELLAPLIGLALTQVLKPLLIGMIDRNPVHGPVVLASMYPIIDVELEAQVAKTETVLDDSAVAAVKKVFEDVAREKGVPLSNLDEDI